MDFNKFDTDLKDMRRRNRAMSYAIGGLIASQLVSLFIIVNIAGMERTVIVPPSIDKTFWVSREKVSGSYLEQMAGYVSWLILDASPNTVEWKKNELLNYVSPDKHGAMAADLGVAAERIRRDNATTSFLIQQLISSEQNQSVLISGRLRTQINGQDTKEPETKSYLAEFNYAGGRIHLKAFKEVPHEKNTPSSIAADVANVVSK